MRPLTDAEIIDLMCMVTPPLPEDMPRIMATLA